MLDEAVRAMADTELRAGGNAMFRRARREAEDGRPTWAALWHALGIELLEEFERRDAILVALDPDEDDDTVGEIIGDVG